MKKNFIWNIVALIAVVTVFTSCAKEFELTPISQPGTGGAGQEPTVTIIENKINKDSLLLLVNEVRSKGCNCGGTQMPAVGRVTWNDLLEFAAVSHAKDMSDNNYFDHKGKNGSTPGARRMPPATAGMHTWKISRKALRMRQRQLPAGLKAPSIAKT
ncbi:CAP domain-containing protein [Chitinophaga sedimenti]|uniref:CAP domain-containing protein n=1 Tax=Chitinophaga sedimenti TaxID=2033606 RepID=UPI0020060D16|nr:CAP domain-containing protein [Chitinophaga sedimenti]MCK7558624.1 CAP domain-containing protein [Chitinophaga sedimenti]